MHDSDRYVLSRENEKLFVCFQELEFNIPKKTPKAAIPLISSVPGINKVSTTKSIQWFCLKRPSTTTVSKVGGKSRGTNSSMGAGGESKGANSFCLLRAN